MDVFPETWPLRDLIASGRLAGPPHHGIGRGFKVGKEEIAGLLRALELYQARDFEAERQVWIRDMREVVNGVQDVPCVRAEVIFPQASGRLVPIARISVEPSSLAHQVIIGLQEGNPPIMVFEKMARHGDIIVMPESLLPGEAVIIGRRIRELLKSR
jgi:seryl-tRNA(Sec) selenium transferase